MRKFPIIICLIIAILSLCLSASTPALDSPIIKTIHPNTNLYATSSLESNVVIAIPQNVTVTTIGEPFYQGEILWQEVQYIMYNGYVLSNNLYVSLHNDVYNLRIVKATTAVMGHNINLYTSHDSTSDNIAVCDGTKMNLVLDDIDYGAFSKVEYEGNIYYVLKSEVTEGLSFNQKIAVIIASVFCGLIIIALAITMIIKKRKIAKS